MSPPGLTCPRCGAANDPSAQRCSVCGQPLPVEGSAGSDLRLATPPPQRPARTMRRRVVLGGIAAGAVAALGGAGYLAYALTPRQRFDPRPPVLTYTGHGLAQDAAWSPDGARVASTGSPYVGGNDSRAVHVWDATTGRRLLLCSLEEQDAAARLAPAGVVWSADGAQLLALVVGPANVSLDRVQVWDAATGQRVRSITVRRTATTWAMNDRYLAVAMPAAPVTPGAQAEVAAQPQDAALMSALRAPTPAPPATPMQAATPTPTPSPPGQSTPLPQSTPPPAWPTQAPSAPEVVEIRDLVTGSLVATLVPHAPPGPYGIEKLVWAPESSTLAISTPPSGPAPSSFAWHIWDVATGQEIQAFEIPTQEYDVLSWSRDGAALALGSGVYDLETGHRTATYPVDGYLEAQAWAPDGRRIAVWTRTGTGLYSTKYDAISLVDASSGRQIALYNAGVSVLGVGPIGAQSRMAWSPDGQHLLVVRQGVEIWRLGQG